MKDQTKKSKKVITIFIILLLIAVGLGTTKVLQLGMEKKNIEQVDDTAEIISEEDTMKEGSAVEVTPQPIDTNSTPYKTDTGFKNKDSDSEDNDSIELQDNKTEVSKDKDSDILADMTPLTEDAPVVTVENDKLTDEQQKKNTKVQKNHSEKNAPEKVVKDNTPEYEAEEKQDEITWIDSGEKPATKETQNVATEKPSGESSGGYLE